MLVSLVHMESLFLFLKRLFYVNLFMGKTVFMQRSSLNSITLSYNIPFKNLLRKLFVVSTFMGDTVGKYNGVHILMTNASFTVVQVV